MKTLHPLLNESSIRYKDSEKIAIQEAEKSLTVSEMIGACKLNIFMYEFRKELKGTLEADEKKIETYKVYLKELLDMNYLSLGHFFVADAIRLTRREWAYRADELIDEGSLFC